MSDRREYARHSRHVTRGPRWAALWRQALDRDGWQCVVCGARHRLANPGEEDLVVIEVWFGAETSEDDIVRHPD